MSVPTVPSVVLPATGSVAYSWADCPPRSSALRDAASSLMAVVPHGPGPDPGRRPPPERRHAILRGSGGGSGAQLVIRLELHRVVQLLHRAVAREGRMPFGVSQDIPRRAFPPAELAHPDPSLPRLMGFGVRPG